MRTAGVQRSARSWYDMASGYYLFAEIVSPDWPERPTPPPLDPDLLGRYLAGEASDAEVAVVRRALMANPNVARALERALEEIDGGLGRPAEPDAAASWSALRQRLSATEPAAAVGDRAGRTSRAQPVDAGASRPRLYLHERAPRLRAATRSRPRTALIAVCAAAVCVAAMLLDHALPLGRRPARADSATAAGRAYATAPGRRAEVLLRDGTRVRLAPASRLRVATDYGAGRRDVYLEGEAFFDVTHDARRPFTVFAANASAQDLGTQFAVRSYPEDGAVQVVVRQGAVALSGVGPLAAGDVGRLSVNGRASVRRRVDTDSALGWLDGQLAFRDAPLAQVLRDLGRWYDVDATADPALAGLPFTGTLVGGSPNEALDVVAAALGLRVEADGHRRTLRAGPGRPPARPPRHRVRPAPDAR